MNDSFKKKKKKHLNVNIVFTQRLSNLSRASRRNISALDAKENVMIDTNYDRQFKENLLFVVSQCFPAVKRTQIALLTLLQAAAGQSDQPVPERSGPTARIAV